MEEENKFEEQPQDIQPSFEEDNLGSSSENVEDHNGQVEVEADGSVSLGKFKNVDELYKAYNNLQAEFTKKSQRLSEILKDKMGEESKPDDDEILKTFLSQNEEATFYVDELKSRVGNLPVKDENAFKRAWGEILYEKLSGTVKETEPIVQKFIKDDEIQDLVIKNYMKQLTQQKIPFVMSSDVGERVTKNVTPKPDTFEEAKKVVMNLLS